MSFICNQYSLRFGRMYLLLRLLHQTDSTGFRAHIVNYYIERFENLVLFITHDTAVRTKTRTRNKVLMK